MTLCLLLVELDRLMMTCSIDCSYSSTYESIGKAFGRKCVHHKETVAKMETYYAKIGKQLNDERLRMALIPENVDVFWSPDLWVPLVKVENVYILPGIPEIYNKMMSANIGKILEEKKGKMLMRTLIYTDLPEGDYSKRLREIAEKYKEINIGSYPTFKKVKPYSAFVSAEGVENQEYNDAIEEIQQCCEGRKTPMNPIMEKYLQDFVDSVTK